MAGKFFAFLWLIGAALALAACNTIEGAGKDIKAGGQAIEKAANKAGGGGGY
jgi:predicted small secreted protein